MTRRGIRRRSQRAMRLLLGALALMLVLPSAQPAAIAAPDVVRTIKVFPTLTQLVLDPHSGQVFVVSFGDVAREGYSLGHAGLTQIDGSTGRVIRRFPNWPFRGVNPLAGHIILRVGDYM